MMRWSQKGLDHQVKQMEVLREMSRIRKSVLITFFNENYLLRTVYNRIDIWWQGKQRNGDLMLLCAYLLKLNDQWKKAEIYIRSLVDDEQEKEIMTEGIKKILPKARIDAKVIVSIKKPNEEFTTVLHRKSGFADIVFLGLGIPELGQEEIMARNMVRFCDGLKRVVFVKNNNIPGTLPILLNLEEE